MGIPRVVAALAAFGLAGCGSTSYTLLDLRNGYQATDLPVIFNAGRGRLQVSGYMTGNDQAPVRFIRKAVYDVDSGGTPSTRHLAALYAIDRSAFQLGGAATFTGRLGFAGMSAGTALPETDRYHITPFAGISPRFGNWIITAGAGLAFNHFRTEANYRSWHDSWVPDSQPRETTAEGGFPIIDVSLPLRFGILYRAGRWEPYASLAKGGMEFWKRHPEGTPVYRIDSRSLNLGCRRAGPAATLLTIEAGREWVDRDAEYGDSHWIGRLGLGWELF